MQRGIFGRCYVADQMRLHRILPGQDDAVGRRLDLLADGEPPGSRAEFAQAEARGEAVAQAGRVQASGEVVEGTCMPQGALPIKELICPGSGRRRLQGDVPAGLRVADGRAVLREARQAGGGQGHVHGQDVFAGMEEPAKKTERAETGRGREDKGDARTTGGLSLLWVEFDLGVSPCCQGDGLALVLISSCKSRIGQSVEQTK